MAKEQKESKTSFFRKHIILTTLISIALIIALFFLGFKIYLYIQYLIGNDLVIQVSVDRADFYLAYGENEKITFEISKVTSPLCKTECDYSFLDISNNVSLDTNTIKLGTLSQKREEILSQDRPGTGQIIYRFTSVCNNVATVICHTNELPVSRNIIITAEYGPNEEQINSSNILSRRVYSEFNQLSKINLDLINLQSELNKSKNILDIESNLSNMINLSEEILDSFTTINIFWEKSDHLNVNQTLSKIIINKNNLLSEFTSINNSIYSEIEEYNSLINILSDYKKELSALTENEMKKTDANDLDNIISNFNTKIELFSNSPKLKDKINFTSSILETNLSNFTITSGNSKANNTIKFNLTKIEFLPYSNNQSIQNFTLTNPPSKCCVYNKCKTCGKVPENYPIIFVHGHDFNKDISAEYSLNAFQDIQNKLDSEEILNAGQLTLYDLESNSSGRLGFAGVPISIRTTYYYDVLKESKSKYLPVQTKSENIDTYSIKLKSLIDRVKYETGQDKVIIVAHSMGGLVSRRYIQLFGSDSVDKLILIGTPNNGITADSLSICSFFGATTECNDLTQGSLFLNKLSNDYIPPVKTYNLIGTGCDMNGEQGDGIVLNKNALLSGSTEFYINGTCTGLDLLHVEILNTNKYPQVYQILKKILNNTSK